MKSKALRWVSILSAATVLAYTGTISITAVGDFALLPVNFLWVCALAIICGCLLSLISNRDIWAMVFTSASASIIVSGVWSYILWSFQGEYISYSKLLISNPFWLYVVPRSIVLFLVTLTLGLAAFVFTPMLIGKD